MYEMLSYQVNRLDKLSNPIVQDKKEDKSDLIKYQLLKNVT